ncbi:hypothetical protein IWX78_000661 [Mycetocola sp. CAN_C7]
MSRACVGPTDAAVRLHMPRIVAHGGAERHNVATQAAQQRQAGEWTYSAASNQGVYAATLVAYGV